MIVHGQGLVGEDAAVPIPGLVGERHDGFLGRFAVDAVDGGSPVDSVMRSFREMSVPDGLPRGDT